MASEQQFSVTLSPEIAEATAIETWLREQALVGHAEFLAEPSKSVAAEELLARIKARRAAQR
jgi:hypothetical protein